MPEYEAKTMVHPVPTNGPVVEAQRFCQMATWRGSQSQYRLAAREWFGKLMITNLVAMEQSESDGNVSITIIYR